MKRLAREPLLHFLLLGVLIFVVFRVTSRNDPGQPGTILVTQGRIESLTTAFDRTWHRSPTAAELDALIRDYVRDEVFAREAKVLGLDKDDTIIRRRLRQKLEFLSEDLATQAEPTDEQLRAYLRDHPDAFRTDRRFTFSQVYFDPQRHSKNLAGDVARVLAQLQRAGSDTDISALGDSVLLDYQFDALPAREVAKQFGEKFAAELGELPSGRWQGPIVSGYGVHLVRIDERTEGRTPPLEEVRDAVRREWVNTRRREANENSYQALLQRYMVVIEGAQAAKDADKKRVAETRR